MGEPQAPMPNHTATADQPSNSEVVQDPRRGTGYGDPSAERNAWWSWGVSLVAVLAAGWHFVSH